MRVLSPLAVVLCVVALTSAQAATWVINDAGLLDTSNFVQETWWPGEGGTLISRADAAGDPGCDFVLKFAGSQAFDKVSIGDDYPVTAATGNNGNLTGYSAYSMTVLNPNSAGWFAVQLFVHTGYVPTPGDHPYMSDWVWLAPGETKTIVLDLSQCVYLNQVTNIGFRVGSNIGTGEYAMPADTAFIARVVPEPGSVTSLAAGLVALGAAWTRRRRR